MLAGAGLDDVDPADALRDGRAMDVWRRDDRRAGRRPARAAAGRAASGTSSPAPATGVLTRLDALAVGVAAWRLGAGRARKEDAVSAGAGVVHARQAGRPGARRASRCSSCTPTTPARFARALAGADGGSTSATAAEQHAPLVIERIAPRASQSLRLNSAIATPVISDPERERPPPRTSAAGRANRPT